jgi:hypothetical protein
MQTNNPLLHQVLTALERGRQTEALAWIDKLVAFCIENENGKVFDEWEPETVRTMVAYHAAKNTLVAVVDKDGNPAAVIMYYVCNEADDWRFVTQWQPDRPDGDSIFLAFLFAANRRALGELAWQLIGHEPRILTHTLLGIRHKRHQGPQRVRYDLRLFHRLLNYRKKNNQRR